MPDPTVLPITRVVLYKSGVGYFEHVGRIRDDQTIAIDLTQGAGVREAKGGLTVDGVLYRPGFLQTTPGWASISGSGDRAISVSVDQRPPSTVIVKIEGQDEWSAVPVTATIRGQ